MQPGTTAQQGYAEKVRAVADYDDAVEVLARGDGGEAAAPAARCRRTGLRDDVIERERRWRAGSRGRPPPSVLPESLVAAAAQRDDDRRDAAVVQRDRLVQPGVKHGRRTARVLGRAEDGDGVRRLGVVDVSGLPYLAVNPDKPCRRSAEAATDA